MVYYYLLMTIYIHVLHYSMQEYMYAVDLLWIANGDTQQAYMFDRTINHAGVKNKVLVSMAGHYKSMFMYL